MSNSLSSLPLKLVAWSVLGIVPVVGIFMLQQKAHSGNTKLSFPPSTPEEKETPDDGHIQDVYPNSESKRRPFALPKEWESSPHRSHVEVAMGLAIQAGSNMKAYCQAKGTQAEQLHDLAIQTKGQPEDFCTQIDVDNETLITKGLLEAFPSHKIIGEESTGTGEIPPLGHDPTWIIDPIDGTVNFASALPITCVSIGLCIDRRPVVGVVYAPMTEELYLAIAREGAYRNGARLTDRRKTNEMPKALREAVINFEFGYVRDPTAVAVMVGAVQSLLEHGCRTVRCLGSGVLDLCYVATGRLDAVYAGLAGEGWKPWDYCAGVLIAQEAGCSVEAIEAQSEDDPSEFNLYSTSIICAVNRILLQELRSVIQSKLSL